MNTTQHIPVLLQEVVEGLQISKGDTVVDATFGGGGHAQIILDAVGVEGQVIGFDRDQSAIIRFQESNTVPENLVLVHANYSDLRNVLEEKGIRQADAIFADLGFSSDQIEAPARGLSFLKDGPLDMRLDQSQQLTAADIVNTYDVSDLARVFRSFGDDPESLKIAKAISRTRSEQPFTTTKHLADFVEALLPQRKRENTHAATRIFQALRIAVNQEREHLVRFLESAVDTLATGGRIAIISFHSGEDVIVKKFFAAAAQACICPREFPVCRCETKATLRPISKKGIRPSLAETDQNPRARSATLRIAEKI